MGSAGRSQSPRAAIQGGNGTRVGAWTGSGPVDSGSYDLDVHARGSATFRGREGDVPQMPVYGRRAPRRRRRGRHFGVPLDSGATYRPGTRFGPRGIRRATNVFTPYS